MTEHDAGTPESSASRRERTARLKRAWQLEDQGGPTFQIKHVLFAVVAVGLALAGGKFLVDREDRPGEIPSHLRAEVEESFELYQRGELRETVDVELLGKRHRVGLVESTRGGSSGFATLDAPVHRVWVYGSGFQVWSYRERYLYVRLSDRYISDLRQAAYRRASGSRRSSSIDGTATPRDVE